MFGFGRPGPQLVQRRGPVTMWGRSTLPRRPGRAQTWKPGGGTGMSEDVGHRGPTHYSAPPQHAGYWPRIGGGTDWPEHGGHGPQVGDHIPGLVPRGNQQRGLPGRGRMPRPGSPQQRNPYAGGREPQQRNTYTGERRGTVARGRTR
jgi:hypothetical protein